MSQISKNKSIPSNLPIVETELETPYGERLLESLKPHANLIMLGLAALFLLLIAVAWMIQSRAQVSEGEWMSLNQAFAIANITGNTSSIKEVADEYPSGRAGLWGLQVAGDYELRRGIDKLATDRTEGIREIEKARNTLQKVVDAPASRKTTMLQVRSTFSLAYAYESLGDFDNARKLYQQLVDEAPDSAFGQAATRGLARTNNPAFAKVYERFKDWEDPFAVAPGDPTTEKPDLSFPEIPEASEKEAEKLDADKEGAESKETDNKDAEKVESDSEQAPTGAAEGSTESLPNTVRD